MYSRRHYAIKNHPKDLDRKAYLLEYFEDYMHTTLWRETEFTWVDGERERNMDFLVKLYRMKHAIMFKLSNDVLQVCLVRLFDPVIDSDSFRCTSSTSSITRR